MFGEKQNKMEISKVKKQSRKIGVAGGFINQMMGNNSTTPVVGEGATILMYSDREAYEVIEVSNDGMQCVIRQMDAKNIGTSYGDERYTFQSNPENHTRTMEWSNKKQCWGEVSYTTEIIKSLQKKYYTQYGFGWSKILLAEHGFTYDDLTTSEYDYHGKQLKLVDGLTKKYKNFHKTSIIFGVMEQYRDPSF